MVHSVIDRRTTCGAYCDVRSRRLDSYCMRRKLCQQATGPLQCMYYMYTMWTALLKSLTSLFATLPLCRELSNNGIQYLTLDMFSRLNSLTDLCVQIVPRAQIVPRSVIVVARIYLRLLSVSYALSTKTTTLVVLTTRSYCGTHSIQLHPAHTSSSSGKYQSYESWRDAIFAAVDVNTK